MQIEIQIEDRIKELLQRRKNHPRNNFEYQKITSALNELYLLQILIDDERAAEREEFNSHKHDGYAFDDSDRVY